MTFKTTLIYKTKIISHLKSDVYAHTAAEADKIIKLTQKQTSQKLNQELKSTEYLQNSKLLNSG